MAGFQAPGRLLAALANSCTERLPEPSRPCRARTLSRVLPAAPPPPSLATSTSQVTGEDIHMLRCNQPAQGQSSKEQSWHLAQAHPPPVLMS